MNLFLLALATLDEDALGRLEALVAEGRREEQGQAEPDPPGVDQADAAKARDLVRNPNADPSARQRAAAILATLEEGVVVSAFRGRSTIVWTVTQEWERRQEVLRVGSRHWRPRAS